MENHQQSKQEKEQATVEREVNRNLTLFISIVIAFFLFGFAMIEISERINNEDEGRQINQKLNQFKTSLTCRNTHFTVDSIRDIADSGNSDLKVTQELVDEFNSVPHCKDFCEEQLEYSKKYSDWFATDDVRERCKSYGVILPK